MTNKIIKKIKNINNLLTNHPVLTQILFWVMVIATLYTLIHPELTGNLYIYFDLFLAFTKDLLIPLIVFLVLIKFILPEIDRLFLIEPTYKKGGVKKYIKDIYFILIFYLITATLLNFSVGKYIEWFTAMGKFDLTTVWDVSLAYAVNITPLLVFFLRLSRNVKLFKGILYVNVLLVLFIWVLEVSLTGYGSFYDKFIAWIPAMFLPTIALAALDILLPRSKLKMWFD